MRDVVVIGGGLSGLAACYELEKCGAAYTVIEVKRRFRRGHLQFGRRWLRHGRERLRFPPNR